MAAGGTPSFTVRGSTGEAGMAVSEAMQKRAVEALELLLGKAETGSSAALATKHTDLLESLRSNMATLEGVFAQDPHWGELKRLRTEVSAQARWLLPCSDVPWQFTCYVLLQLLCLKRSMVLVAAAYSPPPANPRTAEAAPPLSPDTLSLAQEKTVQAALQLVVTLGLCPYLLPGVGLPLRSRTEFSALVQEVVPPVDPSTATRKLYTTCSVLMEVSQHPSLGTLILTRHLGDLLAALCQLGFCPARRKAGAMKPQEEGLTEEERSSCRQVLRGLLDRVYQPLVVRELLLLQGGSKQSTHPSECHLAPAPSWLRRLCGQLLSERLLQPDGVQAVVHGILEGAGAGAAGGRSAEAAAADWQKCDAVARILSCCPQQSLSLEVYYQKICPQVLQLLLVQDKLRARQFQRVATATVLAMARQHPQQFEQHLLRRMLEPLRRCLDVPEVSLDALPAGTVLVKEEELSGCVENIFKVYVAGNDPLPVLLDSLRLVLGVLFSLWCFTKQNASFLRLSSKPTWQSFLLLSTPCQEILLWFLENAERSVALSTLEGLARLRETPRLLHPLSQFQVASEGGASVCIREAVRDEDEALYQKVTSEQWQLEQLSELLSHCQSSGLSGDLFLRCLKELTCMAGQGASPAEASPGPPQSFLGPAEDLQQEQPLRVLQVVAMLCENLSDKLLTDIPQVIEFVATTLQRACVSLSGSSGSTVEAQTLSMAMGLVAAIVGGAVKLSSADFAALKRLVPLLEDVSRVYPEPVIQELAADLRITVCTRGAFSTQAVCSAAQSTLGKSKTELVGKASPDPSEDTSDWSQSGGETERRPLAETPVAAPRSVACSLQELLLSVYDPDIPARAAALRQLSHRIEQRDPEALKNQEKLLQVFVENLQHEDSFVYLSAIQGVALLSDAFPGQVLPSLLAQYSGTRSIGCEVSPAETRMKVGEALMRATRALGDMVFAHRDDLIHAFLRGARDPEGVLRASSLSNLGELCQILHFQLGSVVHEVTSCLVAIVKTDREAEVRRAAVHVVVLLLRGLSERAVEVLQDVLLDLYHLLKFVVRSERDEVTVLHAQLALEELDDIMRQYLFPRQTLEKKIQVLP